MVIHVFNIDVCISVLNNQTIFVQVNTTQIRLINLNRLRTYATCFGPCLGHLHACRYKNILKDAIEIEESPSCIRCFCCVKISCLRRIFLHYSERKKGT